MVTGELSDTIWRPRAGGGGFGRRICLGIAVDRRRGGIDDWDIRGCCCRKDSLGGQDIQPGIRRKCHPPTALDAGLPGEMIDPRGPTEEATQPHPLERRAVILEFVMFPQELDPALLD